MGWLDYHLWEFTIGKQAYGLPMEKDWGTARRIEAIKVLRRRSMDMPARGCGGIPGFYTLLEAQADPEHPDADFTEYLDGWDPKEIDDLHSGSLSGRTANPRNAARTTIAKKTS